MIAFRLGGFRLDARTRAIERQLLVISEAAIRLDRLDATAARRLAPGVDWAGIRGIGKYDDLDASILVDVVRNRLIGLRDACVRAVDTLEGE